jgi:succinate dehydrogenase / fumarate reductase membrane anchor subunit
MTSYRTSLSRVKGLGSAREGTGHFWAQRVTGAINVILLLFVFFSAFSVLGQPYDVVRGYFASPIVAALALMFTISVAYHMRLGMQVIIEDYIHGELLKIFLIALNIFFPLVVGAVSVFALAKLAFGG